MESFVIEGGQPLNGRVRAAGNKNAALPIVAACLLADEPVTLTNVPAILDVDTMLELVQRARRRRRAHSGRGRCASTPPTTPRHELDEELCRRIRASILLAGPLLARCGRADRAAARRRRDRPPPPRHPRARVRAARRDRRPWSAATRWTRPGFAGPRSSSTRRPSPAPRTRSWRPCSPGARPSSRTRPASRTSRISAASSSRSAPRSRGSARTCCASAASSACTAASGGSAPTTSRSRASSASGPSPTASSSSRTSSPSTSSRSGPASSGSASATRSRGRPCASRPGRSSSSADDLGAQIPKIEDGPVARRSRPT